MSPSVYYGIVGFLLALVAGAIVTLVVVLVQSAKRPAASEPPGGRESPLWLGTGATGYDQPSGEDMVNATGLGQPHRHRPKKKRLH